jgi:hypothetical protein
VKASRTPKKRFHPSPVFRNRIRAASVEEREAREWERIRQLNQKLETEKKGAIAI